MKRKLGVRRKKSVTFSEPTIIINNSFTELQGFPKSVLDHIAERFSYVNEEAKFEKLNILKSLKYAHFAKRSGSINPWILKKLKEQDTDIIGYIDNLKKDLKKAEDQENVCWLSDDNKLPTGLLADLAEALENAPQSVKPKVVDQRVDPGQKVRLKWHSEPHEPRYYQTEMIQLAETNERGVFESCVGSGKTLVAANIIKQKRVPTLVILPSSALVQQTLREFGKWFGKTHVQHIKTDLIKKGGKLKNIRLTTIQTLASLQKNKLVQKALKDVEMIIVDEIHHAGSKSYTDLLSEIDHIYYRYGFSGTFLRNDSKTMDMHGFLSNVLYQYTPKQAINDGFLTPTEFIIFKIPGVQKQKYHTEYKHNYCENIRLLKCIGDIVKIIPENEQILILTRQKDKAGSIIHEYLNKLKISNTYVSGDDKAKEIDYAIQKFNEKSIRILIGTKVIGEGVDVHSAQHLILATGGKSEVELVQSVGRCVRLHQGKERSFVYDFQFEDTKFMEKHFFERLRIFKEQFDGEIKYGN